MSMEKVKQEIMEGMLRVTMEKRPGTDIISFDITADSTTTLLHGVTVMVREVAKILDVSVERVLCVVAATMLAPKNEEEEEEK